MLATAAFLGADSFIPLAADRIHGASPTVQGFVIIGAVAVVDRRASGSSPATPTSTRAAPCAGGSCVMAFGLLASVPVLAAGWPLWATFFAWAIGGFGMGLLFNPTTVTAMSHAREGAEGLVSSQVNLADAVGFSMMGGIGGAMVAVSDRTSLPLAAALGLNFALAVGLAGTGMFCAGRIRSGTLDLCLDRPPAAARTTDRRRARSPIDTCTSTWPGRANWMGDQIDDLRHVDPFTGVRARRPR